MKIFLRTLVLFALALTLPAALAAQTDFRRLSDAEAADVLAGFRAARMAGGFCMKFNIAHRPRRSDDVEFCTGTLYGTWDDAGPLFRVEIARAAAPAEKKSFILRGGKNPELWTLGDGGNAPVRIDGNVTAPFFDGFIFTPFDLQTPFIYWENARYERTRRFRGRPVHFFKMTPPENFSAGTHDVGFVRIGFDRVYDALVSAEIFDAAGTPKKTLSLSRVQKVQGQYTIREIELRDERTRDKDEFVVFAAAMNLYFPPSVFSPAALASPPPSVPETCFTRL